MYSNTQECTPFKCLLGPTGAREETREGSQEEGTREVCECCLGGGVWSVIQIVNSAGGGTTPLRTGGVVPPWYWTLVN